MKINRPNSKIVTECVWTKTNEELEFLSSDNGVLSTISSFRYSDQDTMYNNAELRNKSFKRINVKTISLNDLIKREFESKIIQPGNEKSLEKLFEEWKLNPGEKEFTVLDVRVECESESHNFFLYDETERSTSISSMARTTGYTATASVNYLLERGYGKHGVFPPEIISNDTDIWIYINKYLSSRNILINKKIVNK